MTQSVIESTNPCDLLAEDLMTIEQAAKVFPHRPHIASIYRYKDRGLRGVKLETIRLGRAYYTSTQAVHRFIAATNR